MNNVWRAQPIVIFLENLIPLVSLAGMPTYLNVGKLSSLMIVHTYNSLYNVWVMPAKKRVRGAGGYILEGT